MAPFEDFSHEPAASRMVMQIDHAADKAGLQARSSDTVIGEPTSSQGLIEVRLVNIRFGTRDINFYRFERADGLALPATTPGSHIDVHVPNGAVRQYSLIRAEPVPSSYEIGVKLEPNGRGGSRWLHEFGRVGAMLAISAPRNNFPLLADARHSVLIAGGIGVTPIWCMWQALKGTERAVELHYSCRSRKDAVFLNEIGPHEPVTMNFDDENPGTFLDLRKIVDGAPKHAHLYCCGPLPMLNAFESLTADWPAEQVHIEYFSAPEIPSNADSFVIELARSKREMVVPPGRTMLEIIVEAGLNVAFSCEEGVCGACATGVLSGIPDHKDSVLTTGERTANKTVMICCSGSKSERLVLDL